MKLLLKMFTGIPLVFLIAQTGCVGGAHYIHYDQALPPEKTAVVELLGRNKVITLKTYNGEPIAAGKWYVLPLGKARFTVDVTDYGVFTGTAGAKVDSVVFEVDLQETGNITEKTGKYYLLSFEYPWGVGVHLYNMTGEKLAPYEKWVLFAPFNKNGAAGYTPR